MQRSMLQFVRVAFLVVIALAISGQGIGKAAEDQSHLLQGDYAFTMFRACTQALQPAFDQNFTLLNVASPRTTGIQGTLRYNGDGTGSSAIRFINIFLQNVIPGQIPLSGGETRCNLAYTVHSDGSFSQSFSDCETTTEFGAGMGQAIQITGNVESGQISQDHKTLILHDTNPNVETVTVTSPFPRVLERICHRSGTAVKLVGPPHGEEGNNNIESGPGLSNEAGGQDRGK